MAYSGSHGQGYDEDHHLRDLPQNRNVSECRSVFTCTRTNTVSSSTTFHPITEMAQTTKKQNSHCFSQTMDRLHLATTK